VLASGEGGFGRVFRALRSENQEYVAVKLVHGVTNGTMEKARLLDCAHPNVVQLIAAFPTQSLYAIVMELCEGSLRDYYMRHGALTDDQITYTMRETLAGLEYIHSKHGIHRDIKAANVLLTASFAVKISDFGISATTSPSRQERSTVCGTSYWVVS
jgi:serine/threonine protein kinase